MTEERRTHIGDLELRDAGDDAPPRLRGYAAVFNSPSRDLGGFREIIRPGAFARALSEGQDVVAHWQHGRGQDLPLGRTSSGTLRLFEDDRGLGFEIDMPETQHARDLGVAVKRGDVSGVSFAFVADHDDAFRVTRDADGEVLRELLDVDLRDVSPVVTPAYSAPSLELRELVETFDAFDGVGEEPKTAPEPIDLETYRRRLRLIERS